jgi:hypothetical protein
MPEAPLETPPSSLPLLERLPEDDEVASCTPESLPPLPLTEPPQLATTGAARTAARIAIAFTESLTSRSE